MRFERVVLRNFKCYEDAEVTLEPGVTVVHGLNGSGKSSLLAGCFFALYGATALERTLEEVVTIGAEEATVEVSFRHDGGEYRLRRRVRVSGDRASTADCVLETPDGTVEGVRDVGDAVAGLLRMDAEAFVNCAYVRQGEVNKLITATPAARQDMIDDLLQLGRLEEYRERAGEARLAVEDVLGERRGERDSLAEQISEKEEKELHATLNETRSELNDVGAEIERLEANREEAEETLADAEATLEAAAERREDLQNVETQIEDVGAAIRETDGDREELADRLAALREDREEHRTRAERLAGELDVEATREAAETELEKLDATLDALQTELTEASTEIQRHESEAETAAERAAELAERATEAREEADQLAAEAEADEEAVAERRERLDELEADIDRHREQLADAPVEPDGLEDRHEGVVADLEELRERETELAADLESARERVAEAETLLEEGNCPECGQPVEDSPHVDALDERRERVSDLEDELAAVREDREQLVERRDHLEDHLEAAAELDRLEENRGDVEQLLAEKEEAAAEAREEAGERREAADELTGEAEDRRAAAEAARERAAETRERVAELNERRADLDERCETLEELREALEAAEEAAEEADRVVERREMLADRNDERRGRLSELRERRTELADAVDEGRIEEAREQKERAESYLEDVAAELAELEAERDDLQGAVGAIENELDELEALRERHETVADRVEALESLHAQADELETTYGDLRAELRRENVARLETLLNETFELVYGNDSYTHIELSRSYELTVYQKSGEPIAPEQLSGGERALFNLSLRCAVYRLLAEGIEGAAPMPPLILDEPTVFLDSGHVSRLVDLVESMRSVGVEQIIVVSHDEGLVAGADDVVRVEKNPTTNRSRVVRGPVAAED